MQTRTRCFAALLIIGLAAGSCGGGDNGDDDALRDQIEALEQQVSDLEESAASDGEDPTTTTTTSTTTTSTTTTTTTTPGLTEADIRALWDELVHSACPDPNISDIVSFVPHEGDTWLTTDAEGVQLVVDPDERVVYPPDGRDALLPRPYVFCNSETFLGTTDH